MSRLEIASFCKANRLSRSDGARVRRAIEGSLEAGDVIELDFANVRIASVSSFDEAIGPLAREHSLDEIKRAIKLARIDPAERRLLNRIVLSRAKERDVVRTENMAPR